MSTGSNEVDDESPYRGLQSFAQPGPQPVQLDRHIRDSLRQFVRMSGATPMPHTINDAEAALEQAERLARVIGDVLSSDSDEISPGGRFAKIPKDAAVRHLTRVRAQYIDRYRTLKQQEQMAEIKDAVEEKVADPDVRRELSDLVAQIGRQQQVLADRIQAQASADADDLKRINFMKQRWEARKAMLEREPAAVLVGAILLLGIAVALIVAMFTNTTVPDIIASGFLLILGFFFGQNSTRGGSSGDSN
ncbi:hypothetical protein [Nocardia sp. XZ_19_231]|uniref:hypothetical protein n=1 Tax=Nocardia sp. XZ_19_231 TaxID=2769252 RepID=UPI00188E5D87|nr:hypothetical protein [Nocardia sp. XZ_19_231]